MQSYTAEAFQDGAWWIVDLPQIPGSRTQAHRLDEVEQMATEVASLMLEVPASDIMIDVKVVARPADEDR